MSLEQKNGSVWGRWFWFWFWSLGSGCLWSGSSSAGLGLGCRCNGCVCVSPPTGHVCQPHVWGRSAVPEPAGGPGPEPERSGGPEVRPQRPAGPDQQGAAPGHLIRLVVVWAALWLANGSLCVSAEGGRFGSEPGSGPGLSLSGQLQHPGGGPLYADAAAVLLLRPDPDLQIPRQAQSCRHSLSSAHQGLRHAAFKDPQERLCLKLLQGQNQRILADPGQILVWNLGGFRKTRPTNSSSPEPQQSLEVLMKRAVLFWIVPLAAPPWSSTEVLCGFNRTEECRFTTRTKPRTLPGRSRSSLEVRGCVSARRAAVSLRGSTGGDASRWMFTDLAGIRCSGSLQVRARSALLVAGSEPRELEPNSRVKISVLIHSSS